MEIIEVAKHNLFVESVFLGFIAFASLIVFLCVLYNAIKDDITEPAYVVILLTIFLVCFITGFTVINSNFINYDRAIESRIDSILLEQKSKN